jgi:hypothetical protein
VPVNGVCGQEMVERLSKDFPVDISEHALRPLVEHGNAVHVIDGNDRIFGDVENPCETGVSEMLGVLRLLALGNIAGDAEHARRHPILSEQLRLNFDGHAPTLLRHDLDLVGRRHLAGGSPRQHLTAERAIFWCQDVFDVEGRGFLPGVPANPLAGGVDRGEKASQVDRVDDVVRALEQLAVTLLAAAERILRRLMFADAIRERLVRPLQGGCPLADALFESLIGTPDGLFGMLPFGHGDRDAQHHEADHADESLHQQ